MISRAQDWNKHAMKAKTSLYFLEIIDIYHDTREKDSIMLRAGLG
jgi:hypothetical protein